MTPEPRHITFCHRAPDGQIFTPGCFTLGARATINIGSPFDGHAILRVCDVSEDGKDVILTFELIPEQENTHG